MKKFSLIILVAVQISLFAQDLHYTQFWISTLQVNPALTGMYPSEYRFTGHYRNQWFTVPVNYNTVSFTAEKNFNIKNKLKIGLGLITSLDRAGDSKYTSVLPALSVSTIFSLDKNANHKISLGLQAGLWYRQLDYTKLEWDQQYTGLEYNPSLPTGENLGINKASLFDLNTGLCYQGKYKSKVLWKLGLGIFHVLKPRFSIKTNQVNLSLRYTAHANFQFNLNQRGYTLLTDFLYSKQSVKFEGLGGFRIRLPLSRYAFQNASISFGPYYRFNDAVIGVIAAEYRSWLFTFSYDTNISNFVKATGTYGATELSVVYTYSSVKKNKEGKIICPIY